MSLLPKAPPPGDLILCEWRWLLWETCPHESAARTLVSLNCLFSLLAAAFALVVIGLRNRVQGYPLFRKTVANFVVLSPVESVFVGVSVFDLLTSAHQSLVLYAPGYPMAVRGYLSALPHALGVAFLLYFWLSLVYAVPSLGQGRVSVERLRVVGLWVSVALGGIALFLYPALEAAGAHYLKDDEPTARALMTTAYLLYGILTAQVSVFIFVFGRRLVSTLDAAIEFNSTPPLVSLRNTMYSAVHLIPSLCLTVSFLCAILASARYHLWASKTGSLTVLILYQWSPTLMSFVYPASVILRDLRFVNGAFHLSTASVHASVDEHHQSRATATPADPTSSPVDVDLIIAELSSGQEAAVEMSEKDRV